MEISKEFVVALGARIRALRKEAGMTQVAYAAVINLDERNLRRIENGHQMPSYNVLFTIADHHEVHVADLLMHLPYGSSGGSIGDTNIALLKALSGTWMGESFQDNPISPSANLTRPPKPYPVQMEVGLQKGIYTGTISIFVHEEDQSDMAIRVFRITEITTHQHRILAIRYRSQDPEIEQHGTIMVQLDNIPTKLKGTFTAYAAATKSIVKGTVYAKKNEYMTSGGR